MLALEGVVDELARLGLDLRRTEVRDLQGYLPRNAFASRNSGRSVSAWAAKLSSFV